MRWSLITLRSGQLNSLCAVARSYVTLVHRYLSVQSCVWSCCEVLGTPVSSANSPKPAYCWPDHRTPEDCHKTASGCSDDHLVCVGKTIVCVRRPFYWGPLGHVWVRAGDLNPQSYAYWYSVLPLYKVRILKSVPKAYLIWFTHMVIYDHYIYH